MFLQAPHLDARRTPDAEPIGQTAHRAGAKMKEVFL